MQNNFSKNREVTPLLKVENFDSGRGSRWAHVLYVKFYIRGLQNALYVFGKKHVEGKSDATIAVTERSLEEGPFVPRIRRKRYIVRRIA